MPIKADWAADVLGQVYQMQGLWAGIEQQKREHDLRQQQEMRNAAAQAFAQRMARDQLRLERRGLELEEEKTTAYIAESEAGVEHRRRMSDLAAGEAVRDQTRLDDEMKTRALERLSFTRPGAGLIGSLAGDIGGFEGDPTQGFFGTEQTFVPPGFIEESASTFTGRIGEFGEVGGLIGEYSKDIYESLPDEDRKHITPEMVDQMVRGAYPGGEGAIQAQAQQLALKRGFDRLIEEAWTEGGGTREGMRSHIKMALDESPALRAKVEVFLNMVQEGKESPEAKVFKSILEEEESATGEVAADPIGAIEQTAAALQRVYGISSF